jgi:GNAT superfamily N-acetyltransferase
MSEPFVRLAVEADLDRLPQIERSAAEAFIGTGVPVKAISGITPAEAWRKALVASTLWVVDDGDGAPLGFLGAEADDQDLHIKELQVTREHQGQGLGRKLMDLVIDWARCEGFSTVSLTTFRHIPWNGPFYAELGFKEPRQTPEHLAQILQLEAARGLTDRAAMVLEL